MPDATAPLYPPTLTPPEATLSTLQFLRRCAANPLATIPVAAYRDPVTCINPARGYRTVWLCDPGEIEKVLVRDAAHYRKTDLERRLFDPVLGQGVLTAEGADWRWQRRLLAPLFRPSEVRSYVPEMAAAAAEQIARWRAAVSSLSGTSPSEPLLRAIDTDMTEATYAVIVRTMLYGGAPKDVSAVITAGQKYLEATPWILAYGLLQLPSWLPHPAMFKLRRAATTFRASVTAIIDDRRKRSGDTNDLLGRLLAARDPETNAPLTDALLVDNLATLLEAGHETTAKALTWALYLLARAPHWQQRIRDEVISVAGDEPITADHLDSLAITERVIKEALRLYPPAPIVVRTPLQPREVAGYRLEPTNQIVIPIFAIHRHRLLWNDPDRFDPDRFLPEPEAARERTQYMPFGAGPRICLGGAFAMIEAKVLLASFVRAARFEWDGRHLPEPLSRVTLQPKGGMPLLLRML